MIERTQGTKTVCDATDVYGRPARIALEDYRSTRVQLPLYNKTGKRLCDSDWHTRRGESLTIHRENLAIVNGEKVRDLLPPIDKFSA